MPDLKFKMSELLKSDIAIKYNINKNFLNFLKISIDLS